MLQMPAGSDGDIEPVEFRDLLSQMRQVGEVVAIVVDEFGGS